LETSIVCQIPNCENNFEGKCSMPVITLEYIFPAKIRCNKFEPKKEWTVSVPVFSDD
jgi:hypothetical protein